MTFYPCQNFISSRRWLQRHSRATYMAAYQRLVVQGDCMPAGGGGISEGAWPQLKHIATPAQQALMERMVNRSTPRPHNFNKVWHGFIADWTPHPQPSASCECVPLPHVDMLGGEGSHLLPARGVLY